MIAPIFTDEQTKETDKLMAYLKTLSNDALFWLMLCIGAESHRRKLESEGKETRYNATGGTKPV